MEEKKQNENKRGIPQPIYRVVLILMVLAIFVMLNAAVNALPEAVLRRDMSRNNLFSLSETTKQLVGGLTEDVQIYVLGNEQSSDRTLVSVLERYCDLSQHVKVTYVEPASNPSFGKDHGYEEAAEGGVIMEGMGRSRYIAKNQINVTNYNETTYEFSTQFDGEEQLTGAIDYLTTGTLPVVYVINGHEETALPDTIRSDLEKQNLELKDLNLLSEGGIPEDASGIVLYAPARDLSEAEAQQVISFLHRGGSAVIAAGYTDTAMPRFRSILQEYGVTLTDGIVLEGSSGNYYNSPLTLLPEFGTHDLIKNLSSSRPIAMLQTCLGMTTNAPRKTVTYDTLMKTTDQAFAKVPVDGRIPSAQKEAGDQEGPFTLGLLVTENTTSGSARLVVFSTGFLLDSEITESYNVVNTELFKSSLTYLAGKGSSISIPGKITSDTNNTIPQSDTTRWIVIWVILIPVIFLAAGFVIWFVRRRR